MSELITSTANPRIKRLRKLDDRRERVREGVYLAEGLRIVIEAIQLERNIETLVIAPELLVSQAGIDTVQAFRTRYPDRVMEVSAEVFRSFSGKDGPQGIAAVIQPDWLALENIHPTGNDCWVALDEVADPGNLGTILRTTDAAGARGVILLDQCTDPYDPSALRASMGAIFSLGICKATFEQFSAWKKREQISLIGTSDRASADYHAARYSAPLVILMGSEREGLEQRHFDLCDQVVSIPMNGRSDSLNLAVATAILLYETYQQTRAEK
jgi:RNA methyltransferase, TrmH family